MSKTCNEAVIEISKEIGLGLYGNPVNLPDGSKAYDFCDFRMIEEEDGFFTFEVYDVAPEDAVKIAVFLERVRES